MKTQNKKERKVLVSLRMSTFVIILISIITLAIIAVFIGNYITAEEAKTNNLSKNSEEIQNENLKNEVVKSEIPVIPMTDRNIVSSSRSSSGRREKVSISMIEAQEEEVIEKQEEELVVVSTPIEEVTISVDMDLTVRTGLSKDDFIKLISGVKQDTSGFFKENASYIYDMCEKYSLNEIFFCGLISAESGWDIAPAHRSRHNYISLMSANGLIKFATVEEGLEKAAQTLHDRYLSPNGAFYNGSTLAAMKIRFCPASSTWVNLVYGRMEQIMK